MGVSGCPFVPVCASRRCEYARTNADADASSNAAATALLQRPCEQAFTSTNAQTLTQQLLHRAPYIFTTSFFTTCKMRLVSSYEYECTNADAEASSLRALYLDYLLQPASVFAY